MNEIKSVNYIIQKGDCLDYILRSNYGVRGTIMAIKPFTDILSELNVCDFKNTFKSNFKVGQTIKLPLYFNSTDGKMYTFSNNRRNIQLDDGNRMLLRSQCSICNSTHLSEELHELSLGANNHTSSITMCTRCLKLLYKRIGEVLSNDS